MARFNRVIRSALTAIAVCLLSQVTQSAEVVSGYWSEVSVGEPSIQAFLSPKRRQDPGESRLLKLNLEQLRDSLKADVTTNILLPDPYGGAVEFALRPSAVMPKQLAKRYPQIRAFEGAALNDPSTTIRLELTSRGLTAQVVGAGNRWFIDPVRGLSPEFARSYRYSKSYHTKDEPFCGVESTSVFDNSSAPTKQFKGTIRRARVLANS